MPILVPATSLSRRAFTNVAVGVPEGYGIAANERPTLVGLDDLDDEAVYALSEFDGFWSNVTKGFKRVAKIAYERGVPILKYHLPGVKQLGGELAKVGRFVVKQPMLRRALATFGPPILTPAMLEIGASLVEQQMKHKLLQAGKAPAVAAKVKAADKGKRSLIETSPLVRVGAPEAVAGFSPLPAAAVTEGVFAAVLERLAALDPVRQKIVQRLVRAGIPAPTAVLVVRDSADAGETPDEEAVQEMARLGSLALDEENFRNPT